MTLPAQTAPDAGGLPEGGSSSLADGEWHRMHPLTPLFKGGLVLVVLLGVVVANLRDRIVTWAIRLFTPEAPNLPGAGDPVDWVLANNLILVVLLVVLGVLVVLSLGFWLVWRFQQFRITGDHVEVRKGIVFRSHRRAPLDRVQGVNLTRPFPARLIGMAKLEVVGAGTDANVALEYLSTAKAETVRVDILRLASGARQVREAAHAGAVGAPGDLRPASARAQLADSMSRGVSGMITGVDLDDVAPESVLRIPTGRLVGSQLLSGLMWLVFFGALFAIVMAFVVPKVLAEEGPGGAALLLGIGLVTAVPLIGAAIAITWAQIAKSLRYSIAPTPDGVRITFGLLTTVTETIPPGRIFAVEVTQPLLWRPFGWWTVKINRMSGKSASQQQSSTAQQFNVVLPVGARADVERVLSLILPGTPQEVVPLIWEHGVLGPQTDDPYHTIPARAWWRRPFSWRRHGVALTDFALLMRRGRIWRKLALFPLARLQGFSLEQGPIDRVQRVSGGRAHSVTGPVTGDVSGIERDVMIGLVNAVAASAARAAAEDRAHRWAEHGNEASMALAGAPTDAGAAGAAPSFSAPSFPALAFPVPAFPPPAAASPAAAPPAAAPPAAAPPMPEVPQPPPAGSESRPDPASPETR
ncbi:putative membrane protein [Microbacterium resistens]|uniref:Membrane protein n=1 Tax=Microbacterium resistens TaxID=156977 RepID=A0ABU1SAC8_9MICO|nr:PH domain-containing protein [Microbacterium resistens]MDR6866567.1 putative membrane protein [Microbacterium resistens]